MHAGTVRCAWVGCVGSGENRNMKRLKLADCFLCVCEGPMVFWKGSVQVSERVLPQVWLELRVLGQRLARGRTADGSQHGKSWDYKGMMLGGERGKFGVGRSVNKQVRQPVSAGLDRGLGILERADMHDHELAPLMRRLDHRGYGFLADGRNRDSVGPAIVVND